MADEQRFASLENTVAATANNVDLVMQKLETLLVLVQRTQEKIEDRQFLVAGGSDAASETGAATRSAGETLVAAAGGASHYGSQGGTRSARETLGGAAGSTARGVSHFGAQRELFYFRYDGCKTHKGEEDKQDTRAEEAAAGGTSRDDAGTIASA